MAWSVYTHAALGNIRRPRPLGTCDRCGFIYNRDHLRWQYEIVGFGEKNLGVLVCRKCMDRPQSQLTALRLPIDPVQIMNARPGEYSGMIISSSPDTFGTVVPSPLVIQQRSQDAFQASIFQPDSFQEASLLDTTTQIGDRDAIITDGGQPILTEMTVTPYPLGTGDDSYTVGASS